MEKMAIQEKDVDPWESLANAIIIQAAKDYRLALKVQKNSQSAAKTVKECESFFRSQYFATLTTVDPKYLIEKLRKETGKNGRN